MLDLGQRLDFYILTFDDWKVVVTEAQSRLPRIHVDEQYRVTYPPPDQWTGLNLKVEHVVTFKDRWEKIVLKKEKTDEELQANAESLRPFIPDQL